MLSNPNNESHVHTLQEHNIGFIDFIIVNLYPFKETLLKQNITEEDIIENIDIGGPTMLRAAAKNFEHVTVVVDPEDYQDVLSTLTDKEELLSMRQKLAAKVFRHTAHYDASIAGFFTEQSNDSYPETYT